MILTQSKPALLQETSQEIEEIILKKDGFQWNSQYNKHNSNWKEHYTTQTPHQPRQGRNTTKQLIKIISLKSQNIKNLPITTGKRKRTPINRKLLKEYSQESVIQGQAFKNVVHVTSNKSESMNKDLEGILKNSIVKNNPKSPKNKCGCCFSQSFKNSSKNPKMINLVPIEVNLCSSKSQRRKRRNKSNKRSKRFIESMSRILPKIWIDMQPLMEEKAEQDPVLNYSSQ